MRRPLGLCLWTKRPRPSSAGRATPKDTPRQTPARTRRNKDSQTRAGVVDHERFRWENNKSLHLHIIKCRCSEFRKPLHLHLLKKTCLAFIYERSVGSRVWTRVWTLAAPGSGPYDGQAGQGSRDLTGGPYGTLRSFESLDNLIDKQRNKQKNKPFKQRNKQTNKQTRLSVGRIRCGVKARS